MVRIPLHKGLNAKASGEALYDGIARLYPICRSITGAGVRATLSHIAESVPLAIREVPSGTPVFDWTVPDEWNIRDAWVKNQAGERVIDFQAHNLHVVSYSKAVRQRLPLAELRKHLFTLPEQPELVPYRTAYYGDTWGFCLSQQTLDTLPEGDYDIGIDASLAPGSLSYGEVLIPGQGEDEVLLSCHICHPSLANDNLSGVVIAAELARQLAAQAPLRYSYRVLFVPATIGSLTWLAENADVLPRIRHGLVLAGLGDGGAHTYKRSRRGAAEIDCAAAHVLARQGEHDILDFSPYGYDERQYCSPGFNLPVGRLTRTHHGSYPEYHTSADNLDFVQAGQLGDSLLTCLRIIDVLENNRVYVNQKPYGEPQLGRYGLYDTVGGVSAPGSRMALLWVLNLSDGQHSLLDIATRAQLDFEDVAEAARALLAVGLLREAE